MKKNYNVSIDDNSGYNFGAFRKYHLYDNKEDCKNIIHYAFDDWEL